MSYPNVTEIMLSSRCNLKGIAVYELDGAVCGNEYIALVDIADNMPMTVNSFKGGSNISSCID
jgi:hypothetical protein